MPFEFVCNSCLGTHGVLDSERLPAACPACGAADPWVGPVAMTSPIERPTAEAVAYSPFYLAASSPAKAAAIGVQERQRMSVYDVCTGCGYLRGYACSADPGVPEECPMCGHEVLRSEAGLQFPPVYVARTRRALARVPPLTRTRRPRRRGALHGKERIASVRRAVADGSYGVDPELVAESVLRSPAMCAALGLDTRK